ncbi:MAG: membrane protein insertion efficiency factor YidD [Clostridia bacterium]|nr:membrane protein insertion efficiency factor YidD [Clostridia bacterium]
MLKYISIGLINFYQNKISPLLGHRCKYYPSCSEYTKQAIEKYGFFKGVGRGIIRILKCNPFSKGGYDPLK